MDRVKLNIEIELPVDYYVENFLSEINKGALLLLQVEKHQIFIPKVGIDSVSTPVRDKFSQTAFYNGNNGPIESPEADYIQTIHIKQIYS